MSASRVRRIGAAQVAEVYLDRAATVAKDCEYIRRAGERDLDLLVFPEYHVPASPKWFRHDPDLSFEEYYRRLLEEAVTPSSPAVDRLSEAAVEAGPQRPSWRRRRGLRRRRDGRRTARAERRSVG